MEIKLEHLTKTFGATTAVNGISLSIESGKLVSLLGPSGCGKSTILNLIAGILPVTEGNIFFGDTEVTQVPSHKRGIGLVFQNYALYPHMTVLENICFPLMVKKLPKKQQIAIANHYAELTHVKELLARKPGQLSGGQQQRVAIARALSKEPKILLLDEPLSNLDAKLRVEMREEIRRVQKEINITTIFVTHDQEEAASISDRIVLLNAGNLQQYDTPGALYEDPVNLFTAGFIGTPGINRLHGRRNGMAFFGDNAKVVLNHTGNAPEDRDLVLAFRGESIRFLTAEGQTGGRQATESQITGDQATARIKEIYTIGKDNLVKLQLGTQEIRAFLDREEGDLELGQEVSIGFKERGVFLFDAQTGERYL